MTKIILSGARGHMGRVISEIVASKKEDFEIVAGVDITVGTDSGKIFEYGYPIFDSFESLALVDILGDVIVDFSHPSILNSLLAYAVESKTPSIIATTGLTEQNLSDIEEASKQVAMFRSANMSIGISLVKKLICEANDFLGSDFDIEIVERHHNRKVDAPSGTALALADALRANANKKSSDYEYVYDRHYMHEKRSPKSIGISSIRGGGIVGDHEVIFAGPNEVIEINHHAISRSIFADGALKAAAFMKGQEAGMYSMDDLI